MECLSVELLKVKFTRELSEVNLKNGELVAKLIAAAASLTELVTLCSTLSLVELLVTIASFS